MKEAMEQDPMHPYLYPHSIDNSNTQNRFPKPKTSTNTLHAWGKESAALLIAIGSAVGLVFLLMFFDGQELPNWKWGLSLNAVVSFLVVLQRGMVMVIIVEVISNTKWLWFKRPRPLTHMAVIDEASRGPMGIFWLIRRVPSNFIALTAALVAFLSLGMGPLTQQAVQSVPCQQTSFGSNASIPVAQSIPRLFFRYGAGLFNLDAQSVANMLSGMTNPTGTDWRIRAQCPTGTCTFPETHGITHSTMGMCSSCIDVSSQAKQGNGDSYRKSSYSLPDGQNITGQALQSWVTVKTSELNWTRGIDKNFDSILPSSFARFSVLSFTLAGCQANATQGVRVWSNSTCTPGIPDVRGITANVVASSCAVYPCIKNFHGAVSNGILRETLVSTVPAPPFDPSSSSSITNSIVVINDPCVGPDQAVYTSANLSKIPDNTPGTSPVLVSGRNVSVPTNCLFRMSGLHGRAFRLWFESYFSNSCYLYDQSDRVDSIICPRGDWYTNAFFNKGFASHASISGVVKDLAEAATETFRQAGLDWEGVAPAAVRGDAFRVTVCAKIHRAWLLYPILVIAASAILLATSVVLGILENRRANAIPAWKSSVLPLLWHGLGQVDEAEKEDRPMSLKELEVRAANTHVRFGQGNMQWGLAKEQ